MRSIHGAPLKDKLTQRVILASSLVAHLDLPNTQANSSQNQKSLLYAYAPTEIRILVS